MSILDYFPDGLVPRPAQREFLLGVEAAWPTADVIVGTLPTAAGKTACALAIQRWAEFANYIVPNNMLLDQAVEAAPLIPALYRRGHYYCSEHECNCEMGHRRNGQAYCASCPYARAVERAKSGRMAVANYYTYMTHQLHRSTLIVDEAHLMVSTLQDLAMRKLWRRDYAWPRTARSLADLVTWLEELREEGAEWDAKMDKLYRELTALRPSNVVVRTRESYRNGPPEDVLHLLPLDTRAESPIMWPPGRVSKIVLLSATIGPPDLYSMGLDGKRVAYIECGSPIPPANRPVRYEPVGNMSYSHQARTVPMLADWISARMDHHADKGLIHVPYSVAQRLRTTRLADNPRVRWHTRDNKTDVYDDWRSSPPDEGAVLVGSGMHEGLDLAYDAGGWQVVGKIPWPSMADPAIRAKIEETGPDGEPTGRDWYDWQTTKQVLQASGRICRTPDDEGVTYIVDTSFEGLWTRDQERAQSLFPGWWTDALTLPGSLT